MHPIQARAANMEDRKRLKQEFGRDLTFWGGLTNRVLAFDQSNRCVKKLNGCWTISCRGWLCVCFRPQHQTGVPPENIIALYDTICEYGRY